jgi:U32 family peptidase
MRRKDIEIMSPVGSFESLMAAIQAGADSVYFGIDKLNMRSRSSVNFTESDLEQIVEICKTRDVKTYLTLNIVMYDSEIQRMHELIDIAKEKGITAIIAADQSAIAYAHSKNMEVHISTQVNVSNTESVKFYSSYADVMVLARELNIEQINEISSKIQRENITGPGGNKIRLEMFVHGALCMSISGKCYLSLHEQNHSANRGECLQPCRRAYTVKDKESNMELEIDNEYILSPKDLCTIHFLNKILDAGITVLKIEGRARPPEYVYTVTKCYREAVDSYFDGTYNTEKIINWTEQLSSVFNRGFWDGYYLGQRLGEWSNVYGSRATKRKVYVGKGMNYFSNISVAEFLCEASEISIGDEILITGPSTGIIHLKIEELRVDLKQVETVRQGERFSFPSDQQVRRSDKLFKMIRVGNEVNQIEDTEIR